MSTLRFIETDGKLYLWRDIVDMRRRQTIAHATAVQPALFEIKHDCRPAAMRTAAGRYLEPTLFDAGREP
jgi:hypothetical protein